MNYLHKLGQFLPAPLKLADLLPYAHRDLWLGVPELAIMSSLASSGKFDYEDYLKRYPDVDAGFIDPIFHFVRHGYGEGRNFAMVSHNIENVEVVSREGRKSSVEAKRNEKTEYTAIVVLPNMPDNLTQQYRALRRQTFQPVNIVYVIDGFKVDSHLLRSLTGAAVQIVDAGKNYWRRALALACSSAYAALLAPGVVPGEFWMANAMRVCKVYNAVAVANGWLDTGGAPQRADNSGTDAYCDWGEGIMFLPGRLLAPLVNSAGLHFDADGAGSLIQELCARAGLSCVAPMQPRWDSRFKVSGATSHLRDSGGTNAGYIPLRKRRDRARIHLIVVFGKRDWLERCLLSVKAQVYDNYTVTLVDDCCDGQSAQELLDRMQLDKNKFRCIGRSKHMYGLAGYEDATDTLDAGIADIVAHLDGDDWFNHPHVLQQLNMLYANPAVLASYGNMVRLNGSGNDFGIYDAFHMSRAYNIAQNMPDDGKYPFRRLTRAELKNGWANAPWCALHLRSFRMGRYLLLNRLSFRLRNGATNRIITDGSIFVPLLDELGYDSAFFMPDPGYTYQNRSNTSHYNSGVRLNTLYREVRKRIAEVQNFPDTQRLGLSIMKTGGSCACGDHCRAPNAGVIGSGAVITVITPDFIADGVLAVGSYLRNLEEDCDAYVYVCTRDAATIACLKAMVPGHIQLLFPASLKHTVELSRPLEDKYGLCADAYRWSMKGVILEELLASGYDMALFLDPDTYTVSDITDMYHKLLTAPISVFPHFRNPDNEQIRKWLYGDGFFNGGVLAATKAGVPFLRNLFRRCLGEMAVDYKRNLYADQKYYNNFLFEVHGIYINLDQGLNYNTWNRDKVVGLVGPSQRSYLLANGRFARLWHISSQMRTRVYAANDPLERQTMPVVAIYFLTNLHLLLLLILRASVYKYSNVADILCLHPRFNNHCDFVQKLAPGISLSGEKAFFEKLITGQVQELKDELQCWTDMALDSICFDNLALYAIFLEQMFGEERTGRFTRLLRRHDLRYVAEEVLPDMNLDEQEREFRLEAKGAGAILQERIQMLNKAELRWR